MIITTIESKQKWNTENYSQVKVSVPKDLASEFKKKCQTDNISMALTIKNFMRDYCKRKTKPATKLPLVDTRQKRRKAVNYARNIVIEASLAEADYAESIPANLRNSSIYEAAEESVSAYEEAIAALEGIYS